MPGYLPKYPQTNLEKIETDEQLTVGKHQNIWRSGWMWINFKANTVTPHGRRQIPPGLSFFFLLVFWVGERCGMVLPNVDNWKLSSAQRNILLLFASSCLRSPVNWGFRTENQQQKGHVRGLKNRSGNDVTIWYIRNSYHISVFVCISTYIYIYINIHIYILTYYIHPSIYPYIIGLPLDLHHKSDLRLWPLKPNLRGWRGSTSPHDQPRDSMMTH